MRIVLTEHSPLWLKTAAAVDELIDDQAEVSQRKDGVSFKLGGVELVVGDELIRITKPDKDIDVIYHEDTYGE